MSALVLKNLRKVYKNGTVALDDVSFSVGQGEFFGLLGPNGAGKSTSIGIITTLIEKTAGQVKIFGIDLDEDPVAAKLQVGVVPQEWNVNLFETVFEIVVNQAGYYGVPRRLAEERAAYYLEKVGLINKRFSVARSLSGGMKRRLMIARGLVHNPKLLILDEPTAGVDVELRYELWTFLEELNKKGTTIILTTHYLEEAERLCRRIAILDEGRVIKHSTTKELIEKMSVETFLLDLEVANIGYPVIEGVHFSQIDDTTLELQLNHPVSLNQVFNALSASNIQVVSMRNKSNRLERLFFDLINSKAS